MLLQTEESIEMVEKALSVIVPAYNMEPLLPKCLGSMVLDDDSVFARLEIIVVNDGSKDRTSEIAHEFEAKCPGVFRVIDKPNGNYGSCINVGLKAARGFYVRVLDADDYVETPNFHKYLEFVINETEGAGADLIVSTYDRVDLNGKCLGVADFGLQGFCRMTLSDALKDGCRYTIHSVTYKLANLKKMMVEYTKLGNTVFLTSHNIDFVSDICNRVAIINKGNVKGLYDLDEDPTVKDKLKDIFIKIYDEA